MDTGFIYLLQPFELINTNKYILTTSNYCIIGKFKQYKNGVRCLFAYECNNYNNILLNIKKKFIEIFKFIDNKYFEGDELDMIKIFINYIMNYLNNININEYKINNQYMVVKDNCYCSSEFSEDDSVGYYSNSSNISSTDSEDSYYITSLSDY